MVETGAFSDDVVPGNPYPWQPTLRTPRARLTETPSPEVTVLWGAAELLAMQ